MLQKLLRKITTRLYKPVLQHYLKKPRTFYFSPFKLIILPGVFHPGFFYSTRFLLNYINQLNLNQKTLIEVGAGNGLIAFNAARKAKKVIALELNKIAVKGLEMNHKNNSKYLPDNVLQIVESNLFNSIAAQVVDYIIVNPPYYPNKVQNEAELAWNCGEQFEYFILFFRQVINFMDKQSKIIMVLSDQCNLSKIKQIAMENNLHMQLKASKKFLIESNQIYEIMLR